ncbi:hypothetical protein [Streptomyces chartreusis]|uniref:hypothetical protein n=1 Tax=Streptomyces chartreusis TaxID=1969 RepID=UPI00365ABBAF
MSEAIYGLVGALGGALLGAAATISAPIVTGRHARRQEQRARATDEFERLMTLRQSTRELVMLLDRVRDASAGKLRVDIDELRRELTAALKDMRDAADRCEVHGLRFVHHPSSKDFRGATPETRALHHLVVSVRRAVGLLEEQQQRPTEREQRLSSGVVQAACRDAEDARRSLLGVLWERMERLQESAAAAR